MLRLFPLLLLYSFLEVLLLVRVQSLWGGDVVPVGGRRIRTCVASCGGLQLHPPGVSSDPQPV